MPAWQTSLQTPRLALRPAGLQDATALLDYRLRNRERLQAWEPERAPAFFTLAAAEAQLHEQADQMQNGSALHLLFSLQNQPAAIAGICSFTNIIRGPFQACHLGFSIDAASEGQGLMHEALACALAVVFNELHLHRVMANHHPENLRSARLLAKLGFEREGLARAYLHINGVWADHVLTSRVNDRYVHTTPA
ncbi:GNAT family N-acetyltransferase [Herbaspirillum sp.]|uniref:GNAT family N-acetyltransferase n=1 Tax=Herbaspirillum sp. TaxID=1890675 RepID=UPI001B00DCE8|nr:GNAT family N-acetyltransferase [Herbaspirillum sp.]MBO9538344.1 GNAT family N-acetyltransferase [Herbaspirillum sp.]